MVNKDALVRYRVINKCLLNRARTYPTKEEIRLSCMEALGVNYISDRTIEKDIEDMRHNEELGFFAPISYSKKMKGYYYTEDDYSIDKIPLKENDLNALQFAASILSQFGHLSVLRDFSGTVSKISEAVSINRLAANNSLDFIEFDNTSYIPGGPFLEDLILAIRSGRQISFDYKKHGADSLKSYTVAPYLLKQFKSIWYIIGNEPESNKIKTFGLDRIISLSVSETPFPAPESFDRKKYFRHAYGITSYHAEPDEVLLSFNRKTADYIKALPLHHSQELVEEDERQCVFRMIVYPTRDLLMQLLSYGNEMKVLKPLSLRNAMKEILEKTLEQYR